MTAPKDREHPLKSKDAQQKGSESEKETRQLATEQPDSDREAKGDSASAPKVSGTSAEMVTTLDEEAARVIANLTHELKTPLHSILTVGSLLESESDGSLNTEQKKQVSIIQRNAGQLLELINDLLQHSSAFSGKRKLRLTQINPKRVFESVLEVMKPICASKGIKLESNLDIEREVFTSDTALLRQIVSNLLSNAIKFTAPSDSGSAEISERENPALVGLNASFTSSNSLKLEIYDTGIGMPPETREAVFADFYQAERTDSRRYSGVGLGLSLVKKSVSLLEGKLFVQSEPAKGTIFSIELPDLISKLQRPQVALYEPDERLSESIALSLEGIAQIVKLQTTDSLEALVAESEFSLMILCADSNFSELLGFKKWHNIPVIVMAGTDSPIKRAEAYKSGVDDFVLKPFEISELLSKVKLHLARKDSAQD